MVWGIFKNIQDGLKKVVGGIKKGFKWFGSHILSPIAKLIVDIAAPGVDKFIPGGH